MIKKKLKENLKNIILIILIILIIIFFLEQSLRLIFNQTGSFNCYKKYNDDRKYSNDKNCYFVQRYFEKKTPTIYKTDSNGFRVYDRNTKTVDFRIYFIGDSFTFGHLSDYKETYPFNTIRYLNKKSNAKFIEINMGVNGYQFRQNLFLINKTSNEDINNSRIIYGLTPNDLFDLEEKRQVYFHSKNNNLTDYIKIKIDEINLISVKFLTSLLLKNEKIYTILHNNRGNAAGYINKNSTKFWEEKFKIFEEELNELPDKTKRKLIITIIPQQIQMKLLKQNMTDDAISFDRRILSICQKIKIKCVSYTEVLAKKMSYNTHYTLDGHLLPMTNIEYGKLLGEYLWYLENRNE
jgi:hypothetical protein